MREADWIVFAILLIASAWAARNYYLGEKNRDKKRLTNAYIGITVVGISFFIYMLTR